MVTAGAGERFSRLHRWVLLGLFFFSLVAAANPPATQAQSESKDIEQQDEQAADILIVRPLDNNQTESKKRKILFEVEVSSFDPVLKIAINGKAMRIKPAPTVRVKRRLTLKKGTNKIRVDVTTEFETASKVFEIRYRRKKKGPVEAKKDPFQLITLLGAQESSNALKVNSENPENPQTATSARRSFLILIPRYDWALNKASTLRFQGVVSRDILACTDTQEQCRKGTDDPTTEELDTIPGTENENLLKGQQIAFTQVTANWIRNTSKLNSWSLGIGYNLISLIEDSIATGDDKKEHDLFLSSTMHRGLGAKSFYEVGLELKSQEVTTEPVDATIIDETSGEPITVPAGDLNEDALTTTLQGTLEGPVFGLKGKLKGSFARVDTEGKLKVKDVQKLSAGITIPMGTFILGLGVKASKNKFKEPNPIAGGVKPEQTLISPNVTATWAISRSWIVTAEYLTESQSSNVPESEYDNSALSASLIYIY